MFSLLLVGLPTSAGRNEWSVLQQVLFARSWPGFIALQSLSAVSSVFAEQRKESASAELITSLFLGLLAALWNCYTTFFHTLLG